MSSSKVVPGFIAIMYTLAIELSPISDLLNFRNSEVHVPQLGEMKSKNSGLLSVLNREELIDPVCVTRLKLGSVSSALIWGEDLGVQDTMNKSMERVDATKKIPRDFTEKPKNLTSNSFLRECFIRLFTARLYYKGVKCFIE